MASSVPENNVDLFLWRYIMFYHSDNSNGSLLSIIDWKNIVMHWDIMIWHIWYLRHEKYDSFMGKYIIIIAKHMCIRSAFCAFEFFISGFTFRDFLYGNLT